uniref:Putative ovule protein n=1 Tax=Solanum chacoense TaxID=4108 RepID=A0A0V0I039_SOLCH
MASVDVSNVDLEAGAGAGGHSRRCSGSGSSVCFSDGDEGSCYSQFYSTADGSNYDDYSFACATESEIGEVMEVSRRVSSVAESDRSVDMENGIGETKLHVGKIERDCRICHLSLVSSGPESGFAIELGCSCKNDLAVAHRHCAEAWFKIKGNKTCEICNSLARNVIGPNDVESAQQTNESSAVATSAASAPVSAASEARTCLNGHRFLNFLLACMVFAFVISWLFHFNIPS